LIYLVLGIKTTSLLVDYAGKVEKVSDDEFLVPSSKAVTVKYTVNSSVGVCSCKAGSNGSFCKHQVLVYEVFGVGFPNVPAINCDERYQLGRLAMAEKCPEKRRFLGLQEMEKEDAVCTSYLTEIINISLN